jgi:hypothetical protein
MTCVAAVLDVPFWNVNVPVDIESDTVQEFSLSSLTVLKDVVKGCVVRAE